jgi:hypothetical protein
MAEIPRGLVGHPQRPLDLARGHALLRFAEQQCSRKPLHKGQVGVIKHSASGDRELVVFLFPIRRREPCSADIADLRASAAERAIRGSVLRSGTGYLRPLNS